MGDGLSTVLRQIEERIYFLKAIGSDESDEADQAEVRGLLFAGRRIRRLLPSDAFPPTGNEVNIIAGSAPCDTYGLPCPYGCGSTHRYESEECGHRFTYCVGCGGEIAHVTLPSTPTDGGNSDG